MRMLPLCLLTIGLAAWPAGAVADPIRILHAPQNRSIVLTPIVSGFVRDGVDAPRDHQPDSTITGVVQTLSTPPQEDRGIIEFGIPSGLKAFTAATLDLNVMAALGPFLLDIGVFSYRGDGFLTLSDFDAGFLFASFAYNGESSVHLDVTSVIAWLLSSGAPIAGFGFRALEESPIRLNGPYLAFNVTSLGIVDSGLSAVPEPATLLLVGSGVAYLLRRRVSIGRLGSAGK